MGDTEGNKALPAGGRPDLPVRQVTVNAIVALNVGFFRKAAGLTQAELGERIGWGKTVVSTAERSWEAARTRSFSADDLIAIADALGIPVAALLLPPEDDGVAFRYVVDVPGLDKRPLRDILPLIFGMPEEESSAMAAYRKRVIAIGASSRADRGAAPDPLAPFTNPESWVSQVLEEQIQRAKKQHAAKQIADGLQEQVDAMQRALQERYREAMGSLEEQREELERRVAALRNFERDYRARLNAYLIGQLRELWAEDMRPEVDEMIDQAKRLAGEGGGTASVVVFRQDGTYDIVEPGEKPEQAGRGDEP